MTLSKVIFQISDNNFPYLFDRSSLRLGTTVYVSFDYNDLPKDFYSNPMPSSTPYFVMWIAPSEWYVVLQDKFTLDDSFEERVLLAIGKYLDKETVDKALACASQDIRPQYMFKTSELNNSRLSVISTVIERLDLCSKLSEITTAKQLFHHYIPLVVYLYLTCFDRLGQPSDWIDFGSWLRSSDKIMEREQVLPKGLDDQVENATALYESYNTLYGASTSFYRFLHDIIPYHIRQELLDSMRIEILDNPPNLGNSRQADDNIKEKFLYKLRNDYTHKAQFIPGITKKIWPKDTFDKNSWIMVQQTFDQSSWNTLKVRNWPETIEKVVRIGLAQYIAMIVQAGK